MRRAAAVSWSAITHLSPQPRCMHQAIDPVLATLLTVFTQVTENLPISIHTTTFQPELLNESSEVLIGSSPVGARLVQPCVITTGVDIKQVTQ